MPVKMPCPTLKVLISLTTVRKIKDLSLNCQIGQLQPGINRSLKILMIKSNFQILRTLLNSFPLESEIACSPVTSLHALQSSDLGTEKENLKDIKRDNVSVLTTQLTVKNENPGTDQNLLTTKDTGMQNLASE
ncbi:hypothetical protein GOODEAATRI_013374 [Goodea atripinnis]|uniref:Uncharacterized protein n=1 Tax=Goodea atripinnis TaxID=208336 RepID=A0ABV0NBS9_9TELE